jgi:hypothetical protein
VVDGGQLLVEHLERVDGGGDDRVGSEEAGVLKEGDFKVGVARRPCRCGRRGG